MNAKLTFCIALIPTILCGCNKNNKILSSIEITKQPTKIVYKSGDMLDLTGMILTARYTDGSSKSVTNFTSSITDKLTIADNETTITYKEGEIEKETSLRFKVNTYFHVDYESTKLDYKANNISIEPMDGVTIDNENNIITFAPDAEKTTYTISGFYKGQLRNTVKNTEFVLSNAYIENEKGISCIYGTAKTCISMAKNTTNYLICEGNDLTEFYSATVQVDKKNLEIGGSGTGYIVANETRTIKCDECKIKGSGNFYFEGNQNESAINCNTFLVEEEKTFNAYISNGKNGIKADEGISISSGTFYFCDNATAMKTDISEIVGENYKINLLNGTFYNHLNKEWVSCGEDCYTKTDSVTIEKI